MIPESHRKSWKSLGKFLWKKRGNPEYHEHNLWTGDVDINQRCRQLTNLGFGLVLAWLVYHIDTKFGRGLGYVTRCMGWVWLSCQLATCITNTIYALATEWWLCFASWHKTVPHHWYLWAPSHDTPCYIAYQRWPPSDCRRLRFSVTDDFCAPYKLLYLGRLRRIDLITWVRCPSVCTSVRPQKVFPIPMKFGM